MYNSSYTKIEMQTFFFSISSLLYRLTLGWTGAKCEDDIDECNSNPCQNGGVCIDIHADYMCACTFGK